MYHCTKISIGDLNPHLMCVLCGGYFIDATTIIECLHSFCRTCIVRYLESSKFCPICDVQVHKTRPLLNIRSDKTLQDLVYKLVPGLFQEEMRRRRDFLAEHPEIKTAGMDLEQRGLAHLVPAHSLPDERISLVLELAAPESSLVQNAHKKSSCSVRARERRYLLCPSDVGIGHLKKFLRLKFSLPDKYQIDVFYKQSDEIISDDFTLLDVTFIYSWNRKKPLRLYYAVYEKPRLLKRKLTMARFLTSRPSQTKRAKLDTKFPTHACRLLASTGQSTHSNRHSISSQVKGSPSSKHPVSKTAKFSHSLSGKRAKKKTKEATDARAWKVRPVSDGKVKGKMKTPLSDASKRSHGKKHTMKTTKHLPLAPASSKTAGRKDSSGSFGQDRNSSSKSAKKLLTPSGKKPDTATVANRVTPNLPKVRDSSHSCNAKITGVSNSNGAVCPPLSTSFYRKSVVPPNALSNGDQSKPSVKESHLKLTTSHSASLQLSTSNGSRSASPRLPAAGSESDRAVDSPKRLSGSNKSSRSGSPKLSAVCNKKSRSGSPKLSAVCNKNSRSGSPKLSAMCNQNSRSGSPKLSVVCNKISRSGSPKLPGGGNKGGRNGSPKLSNGKDSSRPSSRGSGMTDIQRAARGAVSANFPSLPVEEKISVDVTMTTSSSETSSDVTSPGAEDRAHSTGLEEPGEFDSGSHVCNVAVFGSRPLPSLARLASNGQSQNNSQGNQTKAPNKAARPTQTPSKPDSRISSKKRH